MIVYMAGSRATEETNLKIRNRLISYFYTMVETSDLKTLKFWKEKLACEHEENGCTSSKLFVDSGAFSAWSRGVDIDLDTYAQFLDENDVYIEVAANLDVIGNPKATWENQRVLEEAGLEVLPTFHYGEDIRWLKRYMDKYEYIALGGMVPISKRDLIPWLNDIFANFVCNERGIPEYKIHGFGMTSFDLMMRYPFYSVDSTSWLVTGINGEVLIPVKKNGEYDYTQVPHKIAVSQVTGNKKYGGHITCLSHQMYKHVRDYINSKGHRLGRSIIKKRPPDYELKDNERKVVSKKYRNKGFVETLITEGITNKYQLRDMLNVEYFNDMLDRYPQWPTKFKEHFIYQSLL